MPAGQLASKWPEVKFDLRFEISDLNYLGIHVHIATAILVASEAIAASK